jgi:hypothetical protein
MSGAVPPLPNTLSWRGAQFKKAQEQLYLHLYLPHDCIRLIAIVAQVFSF